MASTALVYAALHIADLDEQQAFRKKAMGYIEDHGGFDAVRELLHSAADMTALFLAMAGLLDPFTLPDPTLAFLIAPGVLTYMLKDLNAGVVEGAIFLAGVTRYLCEKIKPSMEPIRWIHQQEADKGIEFVESWLNPNGNNNNNNTTVQTDQAIATLFALGRTPESTSVYSAIQWFNKHKIWDGCKMHLRAFMNFKGDLVGAGPYWAEFAEYDWTSAERQEALEVARRVKDAVDVPFLVVDLAQTASGEWICIECNDGQESGYAGINPIEMWRAVLSCSSGRRELGIK
ncbi:MAG: ATP-grasp domain-containing protein [Deltaproteobacteria bacterium]|nr:ATP-grasp domain-containing protein [Deltaproteobacteria bacterium]